MWSAEGHFKGQRSGSKPFDNFIIYPLGPFTHPLSSSPSVDHVSNLHTFWPTKTQMLKAGLNVRATVNTAGRVLVA